MHRYFVATLRKITVGFVLGFGSIGFSAFLFGFCLMAALQIDAVLAEVRVDQELFERALSGLVIGGFLLLASLSLARTCESEFQK